MKGTEKQIAWATEIEANAIRNLENNIAKMSTEPHFTNNVHAMKLMLTVVKAAFAAQDDVTKIIDRREMFAPASLFATCDRWAEMLRSGKITLADIAARNGLKDYKED